MLGIRISVIEGVEQFLRGEGGAAVFLDVGQEGIGISQSRCIVDAGDVDGFGGDSGRSMPSVTAEVDDDSAVEVSFWCVVVSI